MGEQLYLLTKDLNVFQAAKISNVKKYYNQEIFMHIQINLKKIKEDDLFNGLPAPTHLGIVWSKRNLAVLSKVFQKY